MKIIVENNQEKKYFAQLKDLTFLYRFYKYQPFIDLYLDQKNDGKKENDFVLIKDEVLKRLIEKCDFVVDFIQYKDYSSEGLTRIIINRGQSITASKDAENHFIEGMKDILDFKMKRLSYRMPLIPTDTVTFARKKDGFILHSTIHKNCFLVEKLNPEVSYENIKEHVKEYIEASRMIKEIVDIEDGQDFDISVSESNEAFVVIISQTPKKSKISDVFSTLKKRR